MKSRHGVLTARELIQVLQGLPPDTPVVTGVEFGFAGVDLVETKTVYLRPEAAWWQGEYDSVPFPGAEPVEVVAVG